ncbi:MAG: hypothetical protein GY771_09335 [bacterium]|nr:hypothetical protein [bacterium]
MYRILSLNFLAILLIPIALVLVLFGIKRINASGKSGVILKSLLVVNTMLLVLGGTTPAEGIPQKTCYKMVYIPDEGDTTASSDADPAASSYWPDLEDAVVKIERSLADYNFGDGRVNGNLLAAENAINLMEHEGTFSPETAEVLKAYVEERWIRANEEIDCYDRAVPPPDPAYKERDDILKQAYILADLRASGKLDDSAYAAAEDNLKAELEDYIPLDEQPLALKLIIDLVDEVRDRSQ